MGIFKWKRSKKRSISPLLQDRMKNIKTPSRDDLLSLLQQISQNDEIVIKSEQLEVILTLLLWYETVTPEYPPFGIADTWQYLLNLKENIIEESEVTPEEVYQIEEALGVKIIEADKKRDA